MLENPRPFELLKLIRDRVVTNVRDLWDIPDPTLSYKLDPMLDALKFNGWITIAEDGSVEPTERISEMQKALGLSLNQIGPYSADSLIANPVFGRPVDPPILSDVFVLMPFLDELKPVYEDHIKAVVQRINFTVARADDFFAANSIISDVWNAINRAKILVADCTSRNPNVFYEIGIAHSIGKPVVLISQSPDDIPFDIQHMRTLLYDFTPRGMQAFEDMLEKTLTHELALPRSLSDLLTKKTDTIIDGGTF